MLFENSGINLNCNFFKGGNIFGNFAMILQDWIKELGCNTIPDCNTMIQKFQNVAENHVVKNQPPEANEPKTCPRIYGERYAPNSCGSVLNITNNTDMSLGSVICSLYRGVVRNLLLMMPKIVLDSCKIHRIVVTGGCIENNRLLQDIVSKMFELPIRISQQNDAACGVVLF